MFHVISDQIRRDRYQGKKPISLRRCTGKTDSPCTEEMWKVNFMSEKSRDVSLWKAKALFDYEEVVEALKRVFGIVGICPVLRVNDEGFDQLSRM